MIGAEQRTVVGGPEGTVEFSFPEARQNGGLLFPEMRVIRAVSIDDIDYGPEWTHYLNVLGAENRGKGKAFSLGSMAVTLVSAQEVGRMVQSKYPNLFERDMRKKATQKFRSIARRVNAMVATNEKNIIDAAYDRAQALADLRIAHLEDPDALYLDLEARTSLSDIKATSETTGMQWQAGYFACREEDLDRFSRNGLAIDLSNNEELQKEREDLRDFFRGEGMRTEHMDADWRPHVVPFETFADIGKVALTVPLMPKELSLEQPQAIVNDNNPE